MSRTEMGSEFHILGPVHRQLHYLPNRDKPDAHVEHEAQLARQDTKEGHLNYVCMYVCMNV